MITGPTDTVKRARKLRSEMSLPQVMLWRELRKRPGGFKFRREHGAGDYFLDFYVASIRLDIEVDGFAHDSARAVARDRRRSEFLRLQGVATVRIPARAILDDLEAVVIRIVEICTERKATLGNKHPPPRGEGDHAQHGGGAPSGSENAGGLGPAAPATGTTPPSHPIPIVPLHPSPAASGPPPRTGED